MMWLEFSFIVFDIMTKHRFLKESNVTPCFPQIVNITELAKDYGKTHKYEYVM
jgi:hypothetical protein